MAVEQFAIDLPKSFWVKRCDVLRSNLGIARRDFDAAVRKGAIERKIFPGKKYGKYRRDQVLQVFGAA